MLKGGKICASSPKKIKRSPEAKLKCDLQLKNLWFQHKKHAKGMEIVLSAQAKHKSLWNLHVQGHENCACSTYHFNLVRHVVAEADARRSVATRSGAISNFLNSSWQAVWNCLVKKGLLRRQACRSLCPQEGNPKLARGSEGVRNCVDIV